MVARLGIGGAMAITFLFFIPVVALGQVWNVGLIEYLTLEDGVVEYLTAVLFFLASLGFASASLVRTGPKRWLLPLSAACFLVAGEEVSWGQRLFGLGTPAALAEMNVQGETNLHNLVGVHGIVRAVGVVGLMTLFALVPIAVRRRETVRRLADRLRFPVPPASAGILLFVALVFMVLPRLILEDAQSVLDEIGELYVAAAWWVFAVCTWIESVPERASGTLVTSDAQDVSGAVPAN